MKKRNSIVISVLVATISLTVALTGCETNNAKNESTTTVSTTVTKEEITTTTTTETTTTTKPETTTTTTTPETTTTVSTTTETTTTTAPETTTTTAPETTTTTAPETTVPAPQWTESECNKTMYINTGCYSRKEAVMGAETAKLYNVNDKVTIAATTDTGYGKLSDGTFIHLDYLSDSKVSIVTTTKPQTTTTPKPETSKPTEWQPHTHNYVLVSVIEEPIHTVECQSLGTGIYKCETCDLSEIKYIKPECEYVNDRCTVCNKLHPDHIHEWKDYEWTEEVESYEVVDVYVCDCNRHFYTNAELRAHQETTGFDGTCLDCGYYIEKCGDHKEYNPDNPKLWRCICPTCGGHNLERYVKCGGWSNTYEVRVITEEVTHHGKKCICGETQQID